MSTNNNPQTPQQVIIIKHESPWLRRLVLFLLFGWFYPLVALCVWCVKVGWKLLVTYPWRWTVAATKWSVNVAAPWTVKASKQFHARYGWRGWAIVGAVVVALAIIGNLTSH